MHYGSSHAPTSLYRGACHAHTYTVVYSHAPTYTMALAMYPHNYTVALAMHPYNYTVVLAMHPHLHIL